MRQERPKLTMASAIDSRLNSGRQCALGLTVITIAIILALGGDAIACWPKKQVELASGEDNGPHVAESGGDLALDVLHEQ